MLKRFFLAAVLCGLVPTLHAYPMFAVKPSMVDPGIKDFDKPSRIILDPANRHHDQLVLFLTGTNGVPGSRSQFALMNTIVDQGYRVVWLTYDNIPSGQKLCPQNPDPDCAEAFRRMRVYGTAKAPPPITNPRAEAIVSRFTALLKYLAQTRPEEDWGRYLDGDQIDWKRIVVAGHSQGAGMAALIAKDHETRRVVLFSSPWDPTVQHTPAPWLYKPSATPMDRWYAEYNVHEETRKLIVNAYGALAIPTDHILAFDLDLPEKMRASNNNPYHVATIDDPRYAPQWRLMFGQARGR